MVEQVYSLDSLFGSLSDPTRRDILSRISKNGMSVSAIAKRYSFTFAGVAKHLEVLERAGLIKKTRNGKEQIVTIDPMALSTASDYLENFKQLWETRLDSLDHYLGSLNSEDVNRG